MTNEQIHELAQRLRIDSVRAAGRRLVGSPDIGHVGRGRDGCADGAVPALQL
jgi:hypothetical protein